MSLETQENKDNIHAKRNVSKGFIFIMIIIAATLVLCFHDLGAYGFFEAWEGIYAQSAREMHERGTWVMPYYMGKPRMAKPILAYWGIIMSHALLGESEFSARLPGAVTALLGVLLMYYALSRVKNRWTAFITVMVMVTSMYYYVFARRSTPDVYIMVFTGVGAAFLMLGIFRKKRRAVHLVMAYTAIALAFLGKGPIAVVVPFSAIVLYVLATINLKYVVPQESRKDARHALWRLAAAVFILVLAGMFHLSFYMDDYFSPPRWLRYLHDAGEQAGIYNEDFGISFLYYLIAVGLALSFGILGWLHLRPILKRKHFIAFEQIDIKYIFKQAILFVLIFLVIGASWYMYIHSASAGKFGKKFIVTYNVEAFFTKVSHAEKSDYYVKGIMFGFFPWYIFLPVSFIALTRFRDDKPAVESCPETLILCFVTGGVGFFCLATTRFYHYIAPVIPLMAMAVGFFLGEYREGNRPWLYRLGFATAILFFLPTARELLRYSFHYMTKIFAVYPAYLMPRIDQKSMIQNTIPVFAVMLIALLAGISGKYRKPVIITLLISSVVFGHFFVQDILIPLGSYKSTRDAFAFYKNVKSPDVPYCVNMGFFQPNHYYSNLNLVQLNGNMHRLVDWMSSRTPQYCIVNKTRDLNSVKLHMLRNNIPFKLEYDEHPQFAVISNRAESEVTTKQEGNNDER